MATPGSMGMGGMGMAPRMVGPGGMAPSTNPRMMGPGALAPSISPRMMGPFVPSVPPMDPKMMGPFAPSFPPMDPRMMGPFAPSPPPIGSSVKNLNNPLNAPEKDNLISGCPLDYLVTMGTTEPQTTVLSGKKPEIFLFNKFKIIVRDDQGLMN